MWEQGMGFTDLIGRYSLARSEGVVLRYLSDVYRTLRQTVPDTSRTPALAELEEWLGETIRQTDSSLLDEWEALTDPESVRAAAAAHSEPPRPPRPVTANERAFAAMVRRAMWRRVELASRDDVDGLYAVSRAAADRTDPARPVLATRGVWDEGLAAYWAEHEDIGTGPDARGPALFQVAPGRAEVPGLEDVGERRVWVVRQVLDDPAGDHDWALGAVVDLDASDEAGEPVLVDTGLARL
jgi:hypothetical protein